MSSPSHVPVMLDRVVSLLAPALERVPLAALAGVLMVTAVRMVEFGTVGRILRSTRSDALLLLATITAGPALPLRRAVRRVDERGRQDTGRGDEKSRGHIQ